MTFGIHRETIWNRDPRHKKPIFIIYKISLSRPPEIVHLIYFIGKQFPGTPFAPTWPLSVKIKLYSDAPRDRNTTLIAGSEISHSGKKIRRPAGEFFHFLHPKLRKSNSIHAATSFTVQWNPAGYTVSPLDSKDLSRISIFEKPAFSRKAKRSFRL